jgi:hypothetical protein
VHLIHICCSFVVRLKNEQQTNNRRTINEYISKLTLFFAAETRKVGGGEWGVIFMGGEKINLVNSEKVCTFALQKWSKNATKFAVRNL